MLENIGYIEYFEEEMDDREWGTSTSASCCLRLLAQLLKGKVLGPVTEYAGNRISENSSDKDKYVGLICLGAIIEGPPAHEIASMFKAAIDLLLNLLTDGN